MFKTIVLKVHGQCETLNADGNIKVSHFSGDFPYVVDSDVIINETLLSGDIPSLPSPRSRPSEDRPTGYGCMSDTELCRDVLKCDEAYTHSFTRIETEPLFNMMKFVFIDRRKHITDSWVFI